ncbi:MAG: hypothetical protein QM831_06590 [Kofleriaceae bacterium]
MRASFAIVCALAVPAYAELTAAELQKTGEDLAKNGRYTEAIDAFKAADKKEVRASHACLIALAYARKNEWTPAEIWDAVCHARASKTDPLPEWQGALEQQITQSVGTLTPVTFLAEPEAAKVALDEYPDSPFGSVTIHLAAGTHAVTTSAPGFVDDHRSIEVKAATPQQVSVKLTAAPTTAPAEETTTFNKKLVLAGGIVAGLGFVSYGLMSYEYHQLDQNKGFNGTPEHVYDVTRISTIGLWAVGGGMIITGLLMRHSETAPAVAITPLQAGGAMVSVGWQR